MEIIINGEKKTFSKPLNIQEILCALDIESKVVAVALNTMVVKKQQWGEVIPKDNDRLEFLQFMGGGACEASKIMGSEGVKCASSKGVSARGVGAKGASVEGVGAKGASLKGQ
ncbi:thiamine biosynthesis protein ThiS [Helicobacter sp. 12S02634-8]|uniref:sulfur carrier protein ThiS n=1 Tax=Helicobacter sp. 12S02634-8 TaxID=1476199 RepID=UPI000BA5973A|nr:sulfur carrier protein ThiS [Helicobacter sp. 12S02634-8]PAF46166.1 thiamine biosynthesis protein ThiS [Helicobacter sp. 12S02634-8]